MDISKFDVTLKHGRFISGKLLKFFHFALSLTLSLPLITILLLLASIEWDGTMAAALVMGNIMFLSFFAFLVYVLYKNKKFKQKILLFIEDAIELKAYSKKIGENRLGFQPKAVKIQVKFRIDGKTYTRVSTAKVFGGEEGYLGVYKKYADREINILYSPKYDEVLILKDK